MVEEKSLVILSSNNKHLMIKKKKNGVLSFSDFQITPANLYSID